MDVIIQTMCMWKHKVRNHQDFMTIIHQKELMNSKKTSAVL